MEAAVLFCFVMFLNDAFSINKIETMTSVSEATK